MKKKKKRKKRETKADLTQPGLHALGGEEKEDQWQWVDDLHRPSQRRPLCLDEFCGMISLIFFLSLEQKRKGVEKKQKSVVELFLMIIIMLIFFLRKLIII